MRKPDRRALNLVIVKNLSQQESSSIIAESDDSTSGTGVAPPVRQLQCIGYAIRTIFRVLPALGRSGDHANPPPGLGIKHFVVAGVICAALLVGSIVGAVSVILGMVTRH